MALGRRGLLAAMGLLAASACAPARPHASPRPRPPAPGGTVIRTETVRSVHRGADIPMLIAHPAGLDSTEGLPMVLYLHGRDAMNPVPIPYETLDALHREHAAGNLPPFGLVAVDGGYNAYWNDGSSNGDLMSMLLDEVPAWLHARGLGDEEGLPFACAGLSTGGFGVLNYAIERVARGRPPAAVAALAPALPLTWDVMSTKNAFDTAEEWRAADPLGRLAGLGDVPVGVWIGDADTFRPGVEQLVQQYPNTPVHRVLPGGHDGSVFDVVGADMLGFLAEGAPVES